MSPNSLCLLYWILAGAYTAALGYTCAFIPKFYTLNCRGEKDVRDLPYDHHMRSIIRNINMDEIQFSPSADLREDSIKDAFKNLERISFEDASLTSAQCDTIHAWKHLIHTFLTCTGSSQGPNPEPEDDPGHAGDSGHDHGKHGDPSGPSYPDHHDGGGSVVPGTGAGDNTGSSGTDNGQDEGEDGEYTPQELYLLSGAAFYCAASLGIVLYLLREFKREMVDLYITCRYGPLQKPSANVFASTPARLTCDTPEGRARRQLEYEQLNNTAETTLTVTEDVLATQPLLKGPAAVEGGARPRTSQPALTMVTNVAYKPPASDKGQKSAGIAVPIPDSAGEEAARDQKYKLPPPLKNKPTALQEAPATRDDAEKKKDI